MCFFPRWEGRPLHLEDLASALLECFRLGGRESDVDEAIGLHREALPPLSTPADRCTPLRGFAEALDARLKVRQQLTDANLCIDLLREALSPTYRHIISDLDQGQPLVVLGTMLHVRFSRLGDEADLDAAVRSEYEQARTLLSESLHRMSITVPSSPLATALTARFHLRANSDDIRHPIMLIRQALDSWPEGRPEKDSCITNAALILRKSRQHTC
ncbi:hypothetical protein FB451DRAFT_1054401 [Mycena latifolia]|nr:hypothetical protein FB451DRAFT_1054401 [Mycena latifolia]